MPKRALKVNVPKDLLKDALAETLTENPRLLVNTVSEVLEDFAMARAIREGLRTKLTRRETVFRILQGRE